MEHVLGFLGLLFAATVTLFLALRYPALRCVLVVAFAFRAGLALWQFYVAPLPDSQADAIRFERLAWEWGQDGFWSALQQFNHRTSYIYAWAMGVLYALTDRSPLLLQAVNVLLGTASVFYGSKTALVLWDQTSAHRVGWLLAVYPILALYSAITMREASIVFFFLVGLYYAVQWYNQPTIRHIIPAMAFLTCSTLLHPGMIMALLAFVFVLFIRAMAYTVRNYASSGRMVVRTSLVWGAVLILGGVLLINAIGFAKGGSLGGMISFERVQERARLDHRGRAAYGPGLAMKSPWDVFWVAPLRTAYLLYKPFPWDVRTRLDMLGLVDALFYLALSVILISQWRRIVENPAACMLVLMLALLVVAYAFGAFNYGAALRHRAKLLPLMLILAGPWFARLRFGSAPKHDERL
jgi:hypothetical protein